MRLISLLGALLLLTLAALHSPGHASPRAGDPVKQDLQDHKDANCDVADFVDGLSGPLESEDDKQYVIEKIEEAAEIADELLNDADGPLYSPPRVWLFWTPINTNEMDLTETADTACELACEALEAYCGLIEGGDPSLADDAAEALWQCQQTHCHLFDVAGINGS